MTSTHTDAHESLEILIGELMADGELFRAFLRNPMRTLQDARHWGLPLSDSEVKSLQTPALRLWERMAVELEYRLAAAA